MTKKQVQKLRKRVEKAWKDDPTGNAAADVLGLDFLAEDLAEWDRKNYQISRIEYSRKRDQTRAYRRADMSLLARLEAKAK